MCESDEEIMQKSKKRIDALSDRGFDLAANIELTHELIQFGRSFGIHSLEEFVDKVPSPPLKSAILTNLTCGSSRHLRLIFERQLRELSINGNIHAAKHVALGLTYLTATDNKIGIPSAIDAIREVLFYEAMSLKDSREV